MRRKIVLQGGTALTVSLPSKWARRFNLAKGSEVEVKEEGDKVVVQALMDAGIEKTAIDLSGVDPSCIKWFVTTAHKKGYDEVLFEYDTPEAVEQVQKVTQTITLGFEMVDQKENSVTVKNIAGPLDSEFDSILRRIFLIIQSLSQGILDALEKEQFAKLGELALLDTTVNKLVTFCQRILNKRGYPDYKKTCFLYVIIWQLEKVSDKLRDFSLSLHNRKQRVPSEVLELYRLAQQILEIQYHLVYTFDKEELNRLSAIHREIEERGSKLLEKSTKDNLSIVFVMDIADRTAVLTSSVIGLHI